MQKVYVNKREIEKITIPTIEQFQKHYSLFRAMIKDACTRSMWLKTDEYGATLGDHWWDYPRLEAVNCFCRVRGDILPVIKFRTRWHKFGEAFKIGDTFKIGDAEFMCFDEWHAFCISGMIGAYPYLPIEMEDESESRCEVSFEQSVINRVLQDWWKFQTSKTYEVEIEDITLPTVEEIRAHRSMIRSEIGPVDRVENGSWWVRFGNEAVGDGHVYNTRKNRFFNKQQSEFQCVRPVLKIRNLKEMDVKPGDNILIFGDSWLVLNDDTVLCHQIWGIRPLNNKGEDGDFENSYLKKYLFEQLMDK